MKTCICFLTLLTIIFCSSCNTGKNAFDPERKYSPEQLRQDYALFRNILEDSHPSLYWYTTKDSLDHYFDKGYSGLTDSLTEPQFRAVLSYTISKIHCAHTGVRYSKRYIKYLDTAKLQLFPLGIKFWEDTMVVTVNLNRKDSILKRGSILKTINGYTQPQIRDTLFNYLVTDGYNLTGKYQALSTGVNFGTWYKNVFGLPKNFDITYLDSNGIEKSTTIPLYDAHADTIRRQREQARQNQDSVRRRIPPVIFFADHSLQIDTAASTAYMTVNTFVRGNQLKKFFRHSFRELDHQKVKYLIVDVRSNSGGDAGNSTLLTKYLINQKFKLADSLYTDTRNSKYKKYIGKYPFYQFMMFFVTKKRDDGKYHFGYFERHYFHPKTKHHFDGQVYILTGGNSFSATTLFAGSLKAQKNVTVVGEETGGGNYGNTAWMIPDVTLPNTKLRFTLPLFRLVIDTNRPKDGHGVMPDIYALPSTDAIRRSIDFKADKARELIRIRSEAAK